MRTSRVHALRWPHPGASLRPTADGLRTAWDRRGAVEHDVQGVRSDFWGFEPRLCRAYRAQTKGKVESGVKYFKRNFLAGRRFRDDLDFNEQLAEWMATVADVRVHGTTHERPIDRFARERDGLVPAVAGRAFRLEAPLTRVVATDYLVTVDTNRYSVPFTLIGQPVEVLRHDGCLQMRHRGQVGHHPVSPGGRYQLLDPARARSGADRPQCARALRDGRVLDRGGSARRRGPRPRLLRGGLRPLCSRCRRRWPASTSTCSGCA